MDEALDRKENVVFACFRPEARPTKSISSNTTRPIYTSSIFTAPRNSSKSVSLRGKGHFMNPKLLHSQFETL